jgi:hypothetical protein
MGWALAHHLRRATNAANHRLRGHAVYNALDRGFAAFDFEDAMRPGIVVPFILAAFFGAAIPAAAQVHFDVEFEPAAPTADDIVIAHVVSADSDALCFPDPEFSPVERDSGSVELTFTFTDACDPNFIASAWDYPLGMFDAGVWHFDLQVCYSNPPPLPSYCEIDVEATFDVAAGDRIFDAGFE